MPADNDADFECSLAANNLLCSSINSQAKLSIPLDDVVCVVPDSEQARNGYRVLFLQGHDKQASSETRLESLTVTSMSPAIPSTYLVRDTPRHLQTTNIHVVISTLSGTGQGKNIFHRMIQPFLSHLGLNTSKYTLHETQSATTITELAQSIFFPAARDGISQTLIFLSGDGGLVDLVNLFYNYKNPTHIRGFVPPNIILIPTGTGNAMANSTGLLTYPKSALMALVQGTPRPVPAFAAEFSPGARLVLDEGRDRAPLAHTSTDHRVFGAVVASWGIHAALVADSDTTEYRQFGVDRFKMAAKELLYPSDGSETHRYRGEISLFKSDPHTGEKYVENISLEEHMYVLASLVSNLEKGFTISPASLSLDGLLRLVHFGPVSPEEASKLLGLAYQGGRHVHEPGVRYEEIEGLRIVFHEENENWRRTCVDGKIIAVEEGGWMEVHRETRHLLNLILSP